MANIAFESVHEFAALRRHVILSAEDRAPTAVRPSALSIAGTLLMHASFGSIVAAFVWAGFGYPLFGISAFTGLFGAIAIAFVFAFAAIVIEPDADGAFDWQMPGATILEKVCGYVGKVFSCILGAVLTPAFLLVFTMPADAFAGLVMLLVLAVANLAKARMRSRPM
ncbi:hypothetical protein [Microvirga massiliensis]|uniref:hypothetical protein n=1 Tax=Microvirga massiliensis TaxID=1033741 RepID=UPI00062B6289|nr:hypothetical protein [Microvirga massiliensis]